jgi:hypothetical protein
MRTIIVASLGLNAVLVAALAYYSVHGSKPEPAEEAPSAVSAGATPAPVRSRAPAVVNINNGDDFHWQDVESTDFKQYMANLRAIGCPEETIRDLIIAEVNKMFAPRFAALAAETQRFEHWGHRSKSKQALTTQLRAVREERRALLRELLGIDDDPHARWANVDLDRLREEGKFSFLPAEKQEQVRAIMEKYQQQLDVRNAGRGDLIVTSDQSKLLREQRQQELAQVLSPEELKELSLRDSNTADSVRSRFGSVDITEAEYRKLYDLRKAYEEAQGAVADYSDPEKMRQRSEARKLLEEGYKTALGEDRWMELQRQQDPTWRGLTEVAQQNNLSQSVIEQAWQSQRQTGEQIMRILEDRSMAREQRDALVQQLTGEYDRNLRGLLGEQAYQNYKQNNREFMFTGGGGDAFSFVTTSPDGGARSLSIGDGIKTKVIQRPAPIPR